MKDEIIKIIESNPNFDISLTLNLEVSSKSLKNRIYKYPYDNYNIDLYCKNKGRVFNQTYEQYYSKDELEQYLDIYEKGCGYISINLNNIDIESRKRDYNIKDDSIKCYFEDCDISYSDKTINISLSKLK